MGARYFQKRIDTTMRGGIGVEIDAMLDQLSEDTVAVVVPAMPQSRRISGGWIFRDRWSGTDQYAGCTGCANTGKRKLRTTIYWKARPEEKSDW